MKFVLLAVLALVFAPLAAAQSIAVGSAGFAGSHSATAGLAIVKVQGGIGTATATVTSTNTGEATASVTPSTTPFGVPPVAVVGNATSTNTTTITPAVDATGVGEAYAGGAGAGGTMAQVAAIRYIAPNAALLPVLPPLLPTPPVIVAPLPVL